MIHSYPLKSLYGDYVRTLIGLVFMGGAYYFAFPNLFMTTIFGGLTLLFLVFGSRTALRHVTAIQTSPEGIAVVGLVSKRIAWSDVAKVDLKYFSTSRDKKSKDGWMQLKICDASRCLKMESNLSGFEQIVSRVAAVGFHNGAEMNETTVENFTAMGVTGDLPDEDEGDG